MRISDWSSDVCSSDLVAMPGDSGKACTAVQAIFKRLRIQAFMPQQIQQRAGIEISGAGRARDSTQRSERHGGVAAAAVLERSEARGVGEEGGGRCWCWW